MTSHEENDRSTHRVRLYHLLLAIRNECMQRRRLRARHGLYLRVTEAQSVHHTLRLLHLWRSIALHNDCEMHTRLRYAQNVVIRARV